VTTIAGPTGAGAVETELTAGFSSVTWVTRPKSGRSARTHQHSEEGALLGRRQAQFWTARSVYTITATAVVRRASRFEPAGLVWK
jgi:hypothetical protein